MAQHQQRRYDPTEDPATVVEERHAVPAAGPRLDWRRGFLVSDGLLILLGLWLVVSPSVVSYGPGDEKWLPVVAGALVASAAVSALAGIAPRPVAAWAIFGIAAGLFVAGLALADSTAASWNAAAGGALAAFLAIVAAAANSGRTLKS